MKNCPECDLLVADGQTTCSKCGFEKRAVSDETAVLPGPFLEKDK